MFLSLAMLTYVCDARAPQTQVSGNANNSGTGLANQFGPDWTTDDIILNHRLRAELEADLELEAELEATVDKLSQAQLTLPLVSAGWEIVWLDRPVQDKQWYYHNTRTGVKQWGKPEESVPVIETEEPNPVNITSLIAMFPKINPDVVNNVFEENGGDQQRTVETLLTLRDILDPVAEGGANATPNPAPEMPQAQDDQQSDNQSTKRSNAWVWMTLPAVLVTLLVMVRRVASRCKSDGIRG